MAEVRCSIVSSKACGQRQRAGIRPASKIPTDRSGRHPDAANESVCGLYGQAYVAETAIGTGLRNDEYVKIKCTRSTIGKTVG
jgi:hypothetical protein